VPINFRLAGPETAYIVQHSEARAFVAQDRLRAVADSIRTELPIEGGCYVHFGGAATPPGWQPYEALIAAAGTSAPGIDVRPEDLFALMYTRAPPAGRRARCATTKAMR
jgi:fatty-acyl-CoA synthase